MRTSILSRSVFAVASLAIGSVALAATPANAAAANGVTRDQVLTAVNGVRAAQASNSSYSTATSRALRAIVLKACDVSTADGDSLDGFGPLSLVTAGDDADGLLINTYVDNDFAGDRGCTIAAFAATDVSSTLSGSATITAVNRVFADDETSTDQNVTLQTSALSGDAFVTAPINLNDYPGIIQQVTASAVGNATKTTFVKTSTKVADKKSKSEKKAAKTKYDKRLKAAKKSYSKALDKAGNSKSKKAAAKNAYSATKKAYKAKYKYATAKYKIVKKTNKVVEPRPFSISATINSNNG